MQRMKFWLVACAIAAPLVAIAETPFHYEPKNCLQAKTSLKSVQERFQLRQNQFSYCMSEGKGRWSCDTESRLVTLIMDQYEETQGHINRLCPRGRD